MCDQCFSFFFSILSAFTKAHGFESISPYRSAGAIDSQHLWLLGQRGPPSSSEKGASPAAIPDAWVHDWAAVRTNCRSATSTNKTQVPKLVRPHEARQAHEQEAQGSLRPVHMESTGHAITQLGPIRSSLPATAHLRDGAALLQLAVNQSPGQLTSDLHDDISRNAPRLEVNRDRNVLAGDQDGFRPETLVVGAPAHTGGSFPNHGDAATASTAGVFHRMENRQPLGRRESTLPDGCHRNQPLRSGCVLPNHESDVHATLPPGPARAPCQQISNNEPSRTDVAPTTTQTDHKGYNSTNQQGHEGSPARPDSVVKGHQEGCVRPPHEASGAGTLGDRRGGQALEARQDAADNRRHVGPILDRQGNHGSGHGLGAGHTPVVGATPQPPTKNSQVPNAPAAGEKAQKLNTQVNHHPPHISIGKATKTSTAAEIRDLPFHVKHVGRLDTGKIQKLARLCHHPKEKRLAELLRNNTDGSLYTPMSTEDIDRTPPTSLSDADIAAYDAADQTRIVPRSFVLATVKAFPVTEEKVKQDTSRFLDGHALPPVSSVTKRRRGIAWPRWNNDVNSFESEMQLLTLKDQLEQVHVGDTATCADLTMSFSQLGTSEEVQRFHCFRDSHGVWRAFTVMVMGARPSAETMETITDVLASAGQTPKVMREVRRKTHIDNVRFLHPNPFMVNDAMRQFLTNCEYVGASVNHDGLIAPHSFGTSFGVVHDYHAGLAALSEKHLRKAAEAKQDLHNRNLSVRRVCEILGLLFYTSTVLRVNLASYYFPLKWYRRIAHDFERGSRGGRPFGLDTLVRPWPSIVTSFDGWFNTILKNTPVKHELAEPTVTLFCDASKTGCGGILIDGVMPSYRQYGEAMSAGEFSEIWDDTDSEKSISLLETRAAAKTIRYFSDFLYGKTVKVFIDNTSLLGAWGKTYSKSFALNGELLELIEEMEKSGATFTCEYVPSASNLADRPSRFSQRGPGRQ